MDTNAGYFNSSDVTIAVLNYNGIKVLGDCFDSIRYLVSPPGEVLMVDDGSSDGSPHWVREHFPEVRMIEMGVNTKRLNKVRNRALREASKELVLLVDNDVRLEKNCLEELLHALQTLPNASVCMPRALYDNDPSVIYQDGQILHYVATSYALNRNVPVAGVDETPRMSLGWGVQLIDRRKATEVGFFNEAYVMGWGDDGEFNHKMNLAGYLCYHVPKAIVYHKRTKAAARYYGTVRNRWRFILEAYQWKTLVLCLPALIIYEFALFGFLFTKGTSSDYFRSIKDVLIQLPDIFATRKQIQSQRRVKDSELMTSGPIFIAPEYLNSRLLAVGFRLLNGYLNWYWRLVRHVL